MLKPPTPWLRLLRSSVISTICSKKSSAIMITPTCRFLDFWFHWFEFFYVSLIIKKILIVLRLCSFVLSVGLLLALSFLVPLHHHSLPTCRSCSRLRTTMVSQISSVISSKVRLLNGDSMKISSPQVIKP